MSVRGLILGAGIGAGVLYAFKGTAQGAAIIAAMPAPVADAVNAVTDTIDAAAPVAADAVGAGPTQAEYQSMNADQNVQAFLGMIRYSEGTDGPNGYSMLFGGSLFYDFTDHPRVKVPFGNTYSTAAGAYQILAGTWDEARAALGLPDFSPASQDLAAVWLIRRRGALDDVRAGRFADAVRKCAREWASLPGSPYGQPTRTLDEVASVYQSAGGALA